MSAPIGTYLYIDKAISNLRCMANTDAERQIVDAAIGYLEKLRSNSTLNADCYDSLEKELKDLKDVLEDKLYDQRKTCADTWYEWRGDKESTNDLYNAILEASI